MEGTALTDEQLTELRERAREEAGRLVDPDRLYLVRSLMFPKWWATAIIGRPWPGWGDLRWDEVVLLHLAHRLEPDPPMPDAVQAALLAVEVALRTNLDAAFDAKARAILEWARLRPLLPTPVHVGHDWTIGPGDGRDHIVVLSRVVVGKWQRPGGHALCETPTRRRPRPGGVSPLRELDRTPEASAVSGFDHRDLLPTCGVCLSIARCIAQQGGML